MRVFGPRSLAMTASVPVSMMRPLLIASDCARSGEAVSRPTPVRAQTLDLAMPVLDGHQFLKYRAEDPVLRHIPVVVVSANPRPPQPLEGIEAYLQKPLEPEVLLEIIRRTCDEKLRQHKSA